MNADVCRYREAEYPEQVLTGKIVGCAMALHNEIGHGLREKTYERALCIELKNTDLSYSQQEEFPVFYRDEKVDTYVPDLIVEQGVIVDTKTVETISDAEIGQMLNYLRIAVVEVGLIMNFKYPKLQFKRVVLKEKR